MNRAQHLVYFFVTRINSKPPYKAPRFKKMMRAIRRQRRIVASQVVFSLLFTATVLTLVLWYFYLSLSFPYYFASDTDLAAPAESLNINSGKPAYFVLQPGYGMYAIHTLTHRLASSVGLLPVLTLSELDSALNPIAIIAELTDFFRLHSPLAVLIIVIALWSAFAHLFRLPWLYTLGFLIVIGTLESLAIQASLIRHELYSICYWSVAVACVAIWLRTRRPAASWAILLLTGLLFGMSLLTKYQSIFNIAFVFTLAPLFFACHPPSLKYLSRPVSSVQHRIMDGLSITILAFSVTFFIVAYRQPRSNVFLQVLEVGGLSFVGIAFLGLIGACTFVHLMLRVLKRRDPALLRVLCSIDIIVIGAFIALLSPLVFYSDISTGWEYVISNTHATFFIQSQTVPNSFDEVWKRFYDLMVYQPTTYAIYLVSVLILLAGIFSRKFGVARLYALSPLFTTAIVAAGTVFAVRPVARDLIWTDTMLLVPTFVYLGVIVRLWQAPKWIPHLLAVSVLVTILFANGIHLSKLSPHFAARHGTYGWASREFYGTFFTSREYDAIMSAHYPEESRPSAAYRARRYRVDKQIASYVFQNVDVKLDSMSFAEIGRPVWKNDQSWKILSLSRALADSLIVDVSWQVPKSKYFFSDVRRFTEKLDHIVDAPKQANALSILDRRDLDIFIFLEMDDYQRLRGTDPGLVGTETLSRHRRITVHDGTNERSLVGLAVDDYAVVQTDKITRPYFFVIRERKRERPARNVPFGAVPADPV